MNSDNIPTNFNLLHVYHRITQETRLHKIKSKFWIEREHINARFAKMDIQKKLLGFRLQILWHKSFVVKCQKRNRSNFLAWSSMGRSHVSKDIVVNYKCISCSELMEKKLSLENIEEFCVNIALNCITVVPNGQRLLELCISDIQICDLSATGILMNFF